MVIAATTPIMPRVIKTSARVKAAFFKDTKLLRQYGTKKVFL